MPLAKVTRTLQAPQYNPIVMELQEECSSELYFDTLLKLNAVIEDALRTRFPEHAKAIPPAPVRVEMKQEDYWQPVRKEPVSTEEIKIIRIDKTEQQKFYTEEINNCNSVNELEDFKTIAQTFGLMKEWEAKSILLRTDALIKAKHKTSPF